MRIWSDGMSWLSSPRPAICCPLPLGGGRVQCARRRWPSAARIPAPRPLGDRVWTCEAEHGDCVHRSRCRSRLVACTCLRCSRGTRHCSPWPATDVSSGRDRRCVRWGATVSSHVSPAVRVRGVPVLTWLDLGVGRFCVAGDWSPGAHPRPAFGCAAAPSGGWLALMRGGAVLDVPGAPPSRLSSCSLSNCTSLYGERARDGSN